MIPTARFRSRSKWIRGVLELSAAVLIVIAAMHPATAQEELAESAEGDATVLPSVLAQFTTGVENREPIDQVTFVSNDVRKIFLYSDLREMTGQTVIHRWIYDGETVAEVPFEVRGPRWRVWSSKDLLEDWIGDWTVEIVGENDEVIAAETFTYSSPEN